MKVFRGMLVFRRIATTHMSALQAQSQMHPCVAHLQTLFASVGCERFHVPNLIQMCTSFHAIPPLGSPTYDCNPTPFGPVATTTLSSSWAFTPLSTEGPLPHQQSTSNHKCLASVQVAQALLPVHLSNRQHFQPGFPTASHPPTAPADRTTQQNARHPLNHFQFLPIQERV
jgi:hypothetical protein